MEEELKGEKRGFKTALGIGPRPRQECFSPLGLESIKKEPPERTANKVQGQEG